jgi:hypothetical protein
MSKKTKEQLDAKIKQIEENKLKGDIVSASLLQRNLLQINGLKTINDLLSAV